MPNTRRFQFINKHSAANKIGRVSFEVSLATVIDDFGTDSVIQKGHHNLLTSRVNSSDKT